MSKGSVNFYYGKFTEKRKLAKFISNSFEFEKFPDFCDSLTLVKYKEFDLRPNLLILGQTNAFVFQDPKQVRGNAHIAHISRLKAREIEDISRLNQANFSCLDTAALWTRLQ